MIIPLQVCRSQMFFDVFAVKHSLKRKANEKQTKNRPQMGLNRNLLDGIHTHQIVGYTGFVAPLLTITSILATN